MKKCKSILLIDDEELVVLVNTKIIEQTGITEEIKALSNGEEGLNYLKNLNQWDSWPDVIFLDINMPLMDGFEFLKEFHSLPSELTKNIKIIVLTSSISDHDFQTAQLLGCNGYLTKPLTKEKVLAEYLRVLSHSQ